MKRRPAKYTASTDRYGHETKWSFASKTALVEAIGEWVENSAKPVTIKIEKVNR